MATGSNAEWIVPTRDARSLPVVEILTGRGFVSGKSGSGKSNTVGVIAEELLENGYNFLIVDTEGEYYGLQEQYQLLHVGGDEFADVRVGPDHAEKLAEIGLERNVPVILDVSGFDDVEESRELITRTIEELFRLEKRVRKPFLLIVEEMQEYLPQQGGSDELGEILERVSKRGRKRGLGMCGISQRPSSVDKDFITQCDWMAWHRLTWEADVKVVSKIIGSDKKEALTELDPGQAFLMTDWDDSIEKVQFRKKHTHDAGATPGLESYDRPDLKSVGGELIQELEESEGDGQATLEEPDPEPGSLDDLSLPDDAGSQGADPTPEAAADAATGATDEPVDPPGGPDGDVDPIPDPGDVAAPGGDDLDALEDEADAAELQRLRQRNSVLEAEVEELRTLLQSIEPEHEEAAAHEDQPRFAASPADLGDSSGGRSPDASESGDDSLGGPAPGRGGSADAGGRPTPNRSAPPRPRPPKRPEDRTGFAGELLEFGDMCIYLMKSAAYRMRLLGYKVRQHVA